MLVVVLAVVLTGCTVAGTLGSDEGAAGRVGAGNDDVAQVRPPSAPTPSLPASPPPAPTRAEDIQLPLDRYARSSQEQRRTVRQAREILTARCMRDRGFEYTPRELRLTADSTTSSEGPGNILAGRRPGYGLNDPGQARRDGYTLGIPGGATNLQQQIDAGEIRGNTIDDLIADKGKAYVRALYGPIVVGETAAGGGDAQPCAAASELGDNAYGAADDPGSLDRELPQRLQAQARSLTRADPRVVEATRRWSDCMARHGYQYTSPEQAASAWTSATNRPSPDERATAVADVGCKRQVNFAGIWLAVERGYQQQSVDANATGLQEYRRAHERMVRDAEELVAQAR